MNDVEHLLFVGGDSRVDCATCGQRAEFLFFGHVIGYNTAIHYDNTECVTRYPRCL